MGKARVKVPMQAGPGDIFAPDLALKMLGKTTKDGGVVVEAVQESNTLIWLTIEGDYSDIINKQ